jgi:hypothetical protein
VNDIQHREPFTPLDRQPLAGIGQVEAGEQAVVAGRQVYWQRQAVAVFDCLAGRPSGGDARPQRRRPIGAGQTPAGLVH